MKFILCLYKMSRITCSQGITSKECTLQIFYIEIAQLRKKHGMLKLFF